VRQQKFDVNGVGGVHGACRAGYKRLCTQSMSCRGPGQPGPKPMGREFLGGGQGQTNMTATHPN
jgi:hypothetical protein